jgi:hypothetical protein
MLQWGSDLLQPAGMVRIIWSMPTGAQHQVSALELPDVERLLMTTAVLTVAAGLIAGVTAAWSP